VCALSPLLLGARNSMQSSCVDVRELVAAVASVAQEQAVVLKQAVVASPIPGLFSASVYNGESLTQLESWYYVLVIRFCCL